MDNNQTSNNLVKFKNIINNYQNGDYGEKPLSLKEILIKANEEDLLSKLNEADCRYLLNHTSGMIRILFLDLVRKNKEEQDKPFQRLLK